MFEDASQGCYHSSGTFFCHLKTSKAGGQLLRSTTMLRFVSSQLLHQHTSHHADAIWLVKLPLDICDTLQIAPLSDNYIWTSKMPIITTVGFPHLGVMRLYPSPETRTSLTTPARHLLDGK
jgi:hypothetical protein